MQQDHNISAYDHDELINLIPWYVKGKLSADENAVVKQHLDTCESCRLEASNSTALAAKLAISKESWRPSAANFASIMAEVDKLEAAEKPKQASNTVTKAGFFQRLQLVFAKTPRPVRWALAVESLAFAVLAAVMVLPGVININKAQPSAFETLSTPETPPAAIRPNVARGVCGRYYRKGIVRFIAANQGANTARPFNGWCVHG